MKKTRILIISEGVVDEKHGLSGGETRFIEISKNWQKAGYQIELLGTKGGWQLCLAHGLRTKLHALPPRKSNNRLSYFMQAFASFAIPKTLHKNPPDIIYSTNEQLYDTIPGFLLRLKYKNTKWGVVIHWLPPYKWWTRKQSSFINSFLFLVSERLSLYIACLFADKLLAVSESTRDQISRDPIARFFLKKVSSVECGVNVQEVKSISQSVSRKKYDAVFMKRLQAVKGIFDLINTWEKVVKKMPNAKLIIIGSGPDEQKAKNLVVKKNLQKNIKFLGPIHDFKEKFTLIAQSKLFLLPTYEENWAIVIGESMAAGTPVLTYDLKELKQVWKNNIHIVPVGQIDKLSQLVIHFLEKPSLRRKTSNQAGKFINNYDWKNIAEKEITYIKS